MQLGCIKDDKATITTAISDALEKSDIVVTTGGVSVGDFDFVKDVIYELGCDVVFKGVRVKPGQHIMVARKDDKFIIGLPWVCIFFYGDSTAVLGPTYRKTSAGKVFFTQSKSKTERAFCQAC